MTTNLIDEYAEKYWCNHYGNSSHFKEILTAYTKELFEQIAPEERIYPQEECRMGLNLRTEGYNECVDQLLKRQKEVLGE